MRVETSQTTCQSGNTPSGDSVGSNMSPVIRNTSQLSKEDRAAMAVYLKSLPPVQGRTLGLATADLKGEVSLVNVFASWCVACREEHPLLMQISREGIVPVHGLNYKDAPADAARWLDHPILVA